jgi:DNA-binding CsgD family transcriptional regulator
MSVAGLKRRRAANMRRDTVLRSEELLPADELAGKVHGVPDRATYLAVTSRMLMKLVPCDVIGWNAIDLVRGKAEVAGFPEELVQHDAGPEVMAVAHDHPIVVSDRDDRSIGPPVVRRMSDVASQIAYRHAAAYNELLRPLGAEYQLAASTQAAGGPDPRGWALNRTGSDFTDDEVRLLHHLQPILRLLDLAYGDLGRAGASDSVEAYDLTARETQILDLCRAGLTHTAIARVLGIRPATVAKHLEHNYAKLGISNRVAALRRLEDPAARP